jgi:hypothetical protein
MHLVESSVDPTSHTITRGKRTTVSQNTFVVHYNVNILHIPSSTTISPAFPTRFVFLACLVGSVLHCMGLVCFLVDMLHARMVVLSTTRERVYVLFRFDWPYDDVAYVQI